MTPRTPRSPQVRTRGGTRDSVRVVVPGRAAFFCARGRLAAHDYAVDFKAPEQATYVRVDFSNFREGDRHGQFSDG